MYGCITPSWVTCPARKCLWCLCCFMPCGSEFFRGKLRGAKQEQEDTGPWRWRVGNIWVTGTQLSWGGRWEFNSPQTSWVVIEAHTGREDSLLEEVDLERYGWFHTVKNGWECTEHCNENSTSKAQAEVKRGSPRQSSENPRCGLSCLSEWIQDVLLLVPIYRRNS